MIFQLTSRQANESIGTPDDALCVQLVFTGTNGTAPDNPPGPGIYNSTLQLAVTKADAANYTMGAYYALNLDEVAAPEGA